MNRILFLAQTRVVQSLSAVLIVAATFALSADVWAGTNMAVPPCGKTFPRCRGFCPPNQVCVKGMFGFPTKKAGCKCLIIVGPTDSPSPPTPVAN